MNAAELAQAYPLLAATRRCRVCGCTDTNACVDPEHGPCWWIEQDLCSHCGEPAILVGEFDRMADDMMAAGARPVSQAELDQFFGWMRKARIALERASQVPPDTFDV
jgi:hypothetical protein